MKGKVVIVANFTQKDIWGGSGELLQQRDVTGMFLDQIKDLKNPDTIYRACKSFFEVRDQGPIGPLEYRDRSKCARFLMDLIKPPIPPYYNLLKDVAWVKRTLNLESDFCISYVFQEKPTGPTDVHEYRLKFLEIYMHEDLFIKGDEND